MILDFATTTPVHAERLLDPIGAASRNDPRLSDARPPLPHTHPQGDIAGLAAALHGYAPLGSDGKVPPANLPAIPGLCPIGTILAWHKDLTGTPALPAQWHECDGSVLHDAGSPYNGLTLPALNAGDVTFLGSPNGAATGTTGGVVTHNHDVDLSTNTTPIDGQQEQDTNMVFPGSYTTTSAPNLPPYMAVIWIIRIK